MKIWQTITLPPESSRASRRTSLEGGAGHFSLGELDELNDGYYHDAAHCLEVALLTGQMARRLGRSKARVRFLSQVALIHDADPRLCAKTGSVLTGIPARVQVTLAWMESERLSLKRRFGWSEQDFLEAMALIARSDYPFDERPRFHGTARDGMAPTQVYADAVSKLPEAVRADCLVDALVLRFADQVAAYTGTFTQARQSVRDLVEELNTVGVPCTVESLTKGTPGFLSQAGLDLEHDRRLVDHLRLDGPQLPTRPHLLRALGWPRRLRLLWNQARFRMMTNG